MRTISKKKSKTKTINQRIKNRVDAIKYKNRQAQCKILLSLKKQIRSLYYTVV